MTLKSQWLNTTKGYILFTLRICPSWTCSGSAPSCFHSGIQVDGDLPIWDSGVLDAKGNENVENHGLVIFCLKMT